MNGVSVRSGNLPLRILIGALLGVAAGVTFGQRMAVLQSVGIAYSRLLEISVFPYLICSLLGGLGALRRDEAARLLRASWPVYGLLWGVSLTVVAALALAIPVPDHPLLLPVSTTAPLQLLDLLIPSNLIDAMARNFVPAVVVFGVVFGVAIQTHPGKRALLDMVEVIRSASATVWSWIVHVAPIGVFALFASTAGTIQPPTLSALLAYTGLFLFGTLALAFVVLPWLLSRIVPRSYRELLTDLRSAFALSMVTTLSFAALPFIQGAATRMNQRAGIDDEHSADITRASLSIAYVMAQVGNAFVMLFVLYRSDHQQLTLSLGQYLLLPLLTVLSGLGSPSASVDSVTFLVGWLGLSTHATDLYVETMTLTRYGQVAASVMAMAFVALIVPLRAAGLARLRKRALLMPLAVSMIVFAAVGGLGLSLRERLFAPTDDAAVRTRTLDPDVTRGVRAVVQNRRPATVTTLDGAGTLQGIRRRGRLTVGYGEHIVPFSYFNDHADLVGFDVETAYRLAASLHVDLEFVPLDWEHLDDDLHTRRFDIVMAGAYATADRLGVADASDFYYSSPIALIARSERANALRSYANVSEDTGFTLAIFHDPLLVQMAKRLFPRADIVTIGSYDDLPQHGEIDAAIWTLGQARAWISSHRGYAAVEPDGIGTPQTFAYLLPPDSHEFLHYLNTFLALEQRDGTRRKALSYWIEGRPREGVRHRWNLLDDVFKGAAAESGSVTVSP